jgi:long-chain acyl-CoA synthetase
MPTEMRWLEHYEEGVPVTVDVPEYPLQQLVSNAAREAPDRIAMRMILKYLSLGLVIQSRFTYRQLDEASSQFAAALHGLGIGKGDRVALMLPNIPQYVIAYYGTLKAGAIIVNTNPTYTPRELRHQLEDSEARAIVMLSGTYGRLAQIREHTSIEHVIIADVQDTLGWPFKSLVAKQLRAKGTVTDVPDASDIHDFSSLLKQYPAQPPQVDFDMEDVALFQYSGGTTGAPKAAMLTHRNLVGNAKQMVVWFTRVEHGKETFLGALPFFHVYGMTVGMLFAAATASELIMVPDPRDLNLILKIIHNEKVSVYPGVPAMYNALINHPDVGDYDLRSVKACLSGGAPLPVEVATKFEEITGGRLVEGYGLTESSPVACANPIFGYRKTGSIGIPVSGTRLAIVSLEPDDEGNFKELEVGEEGEIVIYGPQVMAGYWNREEEPEITIDKTGALHTGDIGKMDEEGYFYVVDRKKDLIIASGYNIVPREVEEVLYMYGKIMEAAVAGVPDPKRGETVKAYVVLQPGESATQDEIRAFCKENLAPYKVPTTVEFRDELPKSQVGKVLRRILVEEELAKTAQNSEQTEGAA